MARDLAMAELLYSAGLRLSELVSTNLNDLDRNEKIITVIGKGQKTRVVPVGGPALAALAEWMKYRPMGDEALGYDSPLFVTQRGTRISPRAVQGRIRQLAIKHGMTQRVHPHVLRHAFASHLLESSGDLRAVQELLGHANIASTQIYTHLDFQHLAKVYDQRTREHKARQTKYGLMITTLSFDLDDTLWDPRPALVAADKAQWLALAQHYPISQNTLPGIKSSFVESRFLPMRRLSRVM